MRVSPLSFLLHFLVDLGGTTETSHTDTLMLMYKNNVELYGKSLTTSCLKGKYICRTCRYKQKDYFQIDSCVFLCVLWIHHDLTWLQPCYTARHLLPVYILCVVLGVCVQLQLSTLISKFSVYTPFIKYKYAVVKCWIGWVKVSKLCDPIQISFNEWKAKKIQF